MAELEPVQWDLDGMLIDGDGSTNPWICFLSDDGLDDAASMQRRSTDRTGDGQARGSVRLRERAIEFQFGLTQPTDDQLDSLRAVLNPPTDRFTPRVLRWRREQGPTKRVLYVPDSEPLTMPGTLASVIYGMPTGRISIVADDPVIYSDAETETEFTVTSGVTDTETVTNAGSLAAVSAGHPLLGTMKWTLTTTSTVVDPWFRHAEHPEETWRVSGSIASGQTITVGYDRVTRQGLTQLSATVRGAGSAPIPCWPVLRPGDNDVEFGCTSGSFTATLTHRSTW